MENNINLDFKNLKEKIKLSEKEKVFHREEILKFINKKKKSPYKKEIISSPLSFGIIIRKHFMLSGLAVVIFLSTGVIVNAEQSLPNDYLYQVKIKIIEPTKILLTTNTEKKTKMRIDMIDKTLQDFSKVSQTKNIKKEDKVAIIDSISNNSKEINKEVVKLSEKEDTSDSFEIANNLQSVLSAHSIVIDKINTINKKTNNINDVEDVSIKIISELNNTNETVDGITDKMQKNEDITKIDQAINKQKNKINTSVEEIKKTTNNSLNDDLKKEKEDSIDKKDNQIKKELSLINEIFEEGNKKLEEGNKKEAFILYNKTNQKLGELKSLINSGKNLNIDTLDKNNINNINDDRDIIIEKTSGETVNENKNTVNKINSEEILSDDTKKYE